jgi:hypothetical protein
MRTRGMLPVLGLLSQTEERARPTMQKLHGFDQLSIFGVVMVSSIPIVASCAPLFASISQICCHRLLDSRKPRR